MEILTLENPHWEALTSNTQKAFHVLSHIDIIHNFYLAGGTGLALHLGHRFSVDLDFFSERKDAVNSADRSILREGIQSPGLEIVLDKETTFVANWNKVGISFFRLEDYWG